MIQRHLAIRFAAPPVGPRRWRPPEDVRDEAALGTWAADCPQPPSQSASRAPGQSEDCLFLNIWAPEGADGLPVLVWFHGGSFLFGSASAENADGALLASLGCVVVSAAYRVGLFGYLAHPALTAESPEGSSGNYGLLDNLSALRWVRDRIGDFGGDPRRVTAFGVSAGSASLALLQTSPLAEGLFDQLIFHSPGAFRPLGTLAQAEAGGEAAYGPDIAALRAWSAGEVVEQAAALTPRVRGLTSARLARPICDGWVVPTDDRLSYKAGRFHAVPTIVGGNLDEGSMLTAAWPIATVAEYSGLMAANFGAFAEEALVHYPAATDRDVRRAVADVFGDTQFALGARGIAAAVAARQPQTWRYLYTWRPPGREDGPHHGEEVAGLFVRSTPAGVAMADAWVRFAATGDPNDPAGSAGSAGSATEWPRYSSPADEYMEFGDSSRVGSGWRAAQLEFLERYYG